MLVEEGLHPLGEIALQLCLRLLRAVRRQAQFPDALLAAGTLLPPHLRSLVAADMDVFRREDLHQFRQHTFHETESLLLAGTEDILEHAPVALHLVGTARAAQFGIGLQRSQHVARHVNLGNHRDIAFLGIAHDFLQLLLRETAAVGRTVVNRRVAAQYRVVALRALLYQLRIAVNGHAPALVVGQVPVETVHIVQRHRVEILLHKLHAEEMAGYIQVHAAIAKPRGILDNGSRKDGLALQASQRLAQRLNAVEHALRRLSLNGHLLLRHDDAIALSLRHLRVQLQHHLAALCPLRTDGNIQAGRLLHILLQELRIPRQRAVFGHNHHLGIHDEAPTLLHHDTPRQRHHVIVGRSALFHRCGSHIQRQAQGQHHSNHSFHNYMFQV